MKKILRKITIFSLIVIALLFSQKASAETTSTGLEIIVDVSGSMNEVIDGKSKMNIAKEVLTSTINSIPDTSYVGLRVYGHQGTVAQKNCTDTQLLVPISKINKAELISKVNSLTPNGWTLIDYSLRQAKNDFHPDYGKVIILISDGEETCGGDPCVAIKELKNSGFDVAVHTVGFDVGDVAEKQLQCIAEATGGEYKSAKNASELADSLRIFSTRAFEGFTTAGGTTAGTGFTNAPLVTAGKFGGDVLIEENKFYKINAKKGQEIIAVLNIRRETAFDTYQPRVTDNSGVAGTNIVNCYSDMMPSLKIYDKYQSQVASGNGEDSFDAKPIEGEDVSMNSYKTSWTADSAGEVFISISNSWQYPPNSSACKNHQDQKYQKAFYDLVIAVEGEGEADLISAKTTGTANTDNPTASLNYDDSTQSSEEKGSGMIFVLIGIGILIIAGLALTVFLLLRKKNSPSYENIPTNITTPPLPQQKSPFQSDNIQQNNPAINPTPPPTQNPNQSNNQDQGNSDFPKN